MARYLPHSLVLQISQMFAQGQSFFAQAKVADWLKLRQENPQDYEIQFQQSPAPPGSGLVYQVAVILKRKDGKPVDLWLLEQLESESKFGPGHQ
ncbi:hypothetical protein [Synechococcus sp. PCC 6312]|uniref:hypothetical protein n=1 Tax=Synechococcus sp. (strain ATCC 27167 / PCC 6312) TaxID=195253 RepID=UPI00029F40F8|nr:hypothetical protein [Synechococcus sp. PCC 6312]AFY62702.1 hypothetical protein Syn6312_3690 [Synechococcus sp. PCC 6312]